MLAITFQSVSCIKFPAMDKNREEESIVATRGPRPPVRATYISGSTLHPMAKIYSMGARSSRTLSFTKLVTTMGNIEDENRYTINKPRPEDSLNFMKRAPVARRIRSQSRRVLYENAFDIAKEAHIPPSKICLST